MYPLSQELYIFNKFGQHVLTKDIMTGNIVYKLSYTQATSNGKLMSVTDAHGKTLTLMRDYRCLSYQKYKYCFTSIFNFK
jgi:hypothetical protein